MPGRRNFSCWYLLLHFRPGGEATTVRPDRRLSNWLPPSIIAARKEERAMTYNVIYDIAAPIEAYDALHSAVRDEVGDKDLGLLAHLGRATENGFQIIEVWESRDRLD
jgi:hypothetical protein